MMYKSPLTLYVIWHPSFAQGKEIATSLYSTFCRDIKDPLSRGLGIPVYYRSVFVGKAPILIDTTNATRNVIVLLIDQHFMIDDGFRAYTETLTVLVDDKTRVYPVALCDQAYSIGCNLDKL